MFNPKNNSHYKKYKFGSSKGINYSTIIVKLVNLKLGLSMISEKTHLSILLVGLPVCFNQRRL